MNSEWYMRMPYVYLPCTSHCLFWFRLFVTLLYFCVRVSFCFCTDCFACFESWLPVKSPVSNVSCRTPRFERNRWRFYVFNNSVKNEPILVIFGAWNPEMFDKNDCKFVHCAWEMLSHYLVRCEPLSSSWSPTCISKQNSSETLVACNKLFNLLRITNCYSL